MKKFLFVILFFLAPVSVFATVSGDQVNSDLFPTNFGGSSGSDACYVYRQADGGTGSHFATPACSSWNGSIWSDHLPNDDYWVVETNPDFACDSFDYDTCVGGAWVVENSAFSVVDFVPSPSPEATSTGFVQDTTNAPLFYSAFLFLFSFFGVCWFLRGRIRRGK